MTNYLDRLSRWAATTPRDALPTAVRERACLVIADSLGVTVHGMQTPEMREFVIRQPNPVKISALTPLDAELRL